MAVHVDIKNGSARKGFFRRDVLRRLAERICAGEDVRGDIEISVLFCDDDEMRRLNRAYRGENKTTDVLSFPQDSPGELRVLGDIVISLETVEARHPRNPSGARGEVRLLFCHGLLHLLGYDHQNSKQQRAMAARQAAYLRSDAPEVWFAS